MVKIAGSIKNFLRLETNSLKLRSIRSGFWSLLGKGGNHFLRISGNLVLTRILFPEAFGLMATANVIIMVVQLFSDSGVNIAIIQNPRGGETKFLNTAWIIKIIRGMLLGIVIAVIAWPVSSFYEEKSLRFILLIMSISPFVLGFENPAIPLLVKNFKLSRQVGMELSSQFIGLLTTILLAVWLKSVYALAVGVSISSLFNVILSYVVFPYRPVFHWDKNAGRELFHFGKYVFLNTLITAAVLQLDVLIIGKLLDMDTLSFYNIGKNLGTLVMMFSVSVISQSYIPAVSSVQNDLQRVQRIYQRTVTFFLTFLFPISIVSVLFSHDIIRLLYDPRYQLSYISLLCLGSASILRVIGNISGATFFAIGKPVYETVTMVIGLLLVASFLLIGSFYYGLWGVSCAMAIATSLIPVIECLFLAHFIHFSYKTVLRPWAQIIMTGCVCVGIYFLLRPWLSTNSFYNIPFMILMGLISLGVSIGFYRYLEGPNPFRDYSQKESSENGLVLNKASRC